MCATGAQVMYRDHTGDCDECNSGYYGRTVRVGAAGRSLWLCALLSRVFFSEEIIYCVVACECFRVFGLASRVTRSARHAPESLLARALPFRARATVRDCVPLLAYHVADGVCLWQAPAMGAAHTAAAACARAMRVTLAIAAATAQLGTLGRTPTPNYFACPARGPPACRARERYSTRLCK
jgi:hypothetical protein